MSSLAYANGRMTSEYIAWTNMLQRCGNPKHPQFKDYGGRGIYVCGEWKSSYEAFIQHIGMKPSPELTLDRIDMNGNYEPGNVRWASWITQAHNKRESAINLPLLTSRYLSGKGIYYHKSQRLYKVRMQINKKQTYIGSYKTLTEAKCALENAIEAYYRG